MTAEQPEGAEPREEPRTLPDPDPERDLVEREAEAAGAEAAAIGGSVPEAEEMDEAERPVSEGGGGVAEGFELAEEQMRDAAEHGRNRDPLNDAGEPEAERPDVEYGEPDHVRAAGQEDEGAEQS